MNNLKRESDKPATFLYQYVCDKKEIALAALEMRSLFGVDSNSQYKIFESSIDINPSRSPFIVERIDILYKEDTIEALINQLDGFEITEGSFKIVFLKNRVSSGQEHVGLKERRQIEQEIGLAIKGNIDLKKPEIILAVMFANESWFLGEYQKSEAVWLDHKHKPHSYSTSLNTRFARAVVNIAVPDPVEVKAIDPCCGIGTVVVEALSMDIDMVGSDFNPLVMKGARENIAYYNLNGTIKLRNIHEIEEKYDVAVIDLPYNLCSVLPDKEKSAILKSARSIADKVVIVSIEQIDHLLASAGFQITDRCEMDKNTITRQVIVCK